MFADKCPACRDNPIVSAIQRTDQYVEMHVRRVRRTVGLPGGRAAVHALKRQPLAIRRRLERDPAGIPLDWRPAQQPSPEPRKCPRIWGVKHNLAYPADRANAVVAHHRMMTDSRPGGNRLVGGTAAAPPRSGTLGRWEITPGMQGARRKRTPRTCSASVR